MVAKRVASPEGLHMVLRRRRGGFERFGEARGTAQQLPGAIIEALGMEPEAIAVDHRQSEGLVTTGTALVGEVISVLHRFGCLTSLRSLARMASQQLT